jgi:hypothetical protein
MTFESKRNCGNQISKQIQLNSHGWNFHPMGLWEDESLNLIRQAEGGATIFYMTSKIYEEKIFVIFL